MSKREPTAAELALIDSEVERVAVSNADLLGILSRLQSEHSDLIERERRLEAELVAIPWDAIKVLTYETINTAGKDYIMALAVVADWIVWHSPRTPNIVP